MHPFRRTSRTNNDIAGVWSREALFITVQPKVEGADLLVMINKSVYSGGVMINENVDPLEKLLAASALRDQKAFSKLYELASPKLFGLAIQMLRRRDWAEEVLQEAFIKIWYSASSYHPEKGNPMVWMASIVRYRAIDLLRSQRSQTYSDAIGNATDSALPADETVAQNRELERLLKCVETLAEEQKKSILSAFFEGCSHQELSKKLQVPLGTVKSWIRRGLERVKRCMQP